MIASIKDSNYALTAPWVPNGTYIPPTTWSANNSIISPYDSYLYSVWPLTSDGVDIKNAITFSMNGTITFGANGATSTTDGPDMLRLNPCPAGFHPNTGFAMSFEFRLDSGNDNFSYPAWVNSEYGFYSQGGLTGFKANAGNYEAGPITLSETIWYLITVIACSGNVLLYRDGSLVGFNKQW